MFLRSTATLPKFKHSTQTLGNTRLYLNQRIYQFKSRSTVLPPSPREYPLRGLNLIRLLTQNRIADFHTALESLPVDALHNNTFIKHPVNLERWLMEGSYSKVWGAREEAPAEEYRFFVDSLIGTIRYAVGLNLNYSDI
jgi:26S proteasome regulatory subunit N12